MRSNFNFSGQLAWVEGRVTVLGGGRPTFAHNSPRGSEIASEQAGLKSFIQSNTPLTSGAPERAKLPGVTEGQSQLGLGSLTENKLMSSTVNNYRIENALSSTVLEKLHFKSRFAHNYNASSESEREGLVGARESVGTTA